MLLFYFPDVVCLQQFLEIVILFLSADFSELCVNGIVVGGSLHVADDTKSDGESVAITHEGELQLQGVVLAVSIVNQYIVDGVAILADFNDLQTKALLYETELIVLAEHELLAVLYVDGVLLTTFIVVNYIMASFSCRVLSSQWAS